MKKVDSPFFIVPSMFDSLLAVFMAVFATTAFAGIGPNSFLGVDQGAGSEDNTPCSVGSCFGMVKDSIGTVAWTDFGPGLDGGIVTEYDQSPGGQQNGPSALENGSAQICNAWVFFSAYGTFATAPFSGAGGPPTFALTEVTTNSASFAESGGC